MKGGREIYHYRQAKKCDIGSILFTTIKILSEYNIKMELVTISVLNARCEFGHQVIFRVENKPYTCRKSIGEFSLLKYIQIGAKLQVGGRISAFNASKAGLTEIDS